MPQAKRGGAAPYAAPFAVPHNHLAVPTCRKIAAIRTGRVIACARTCIAQGVWKAKRINHFCDRILPF
jgi:hypothetical protein